MLLFICLLVLGILYVWSLLSWRIRRYNHTALTANIKEAFFHLPQSNNHILILGDSTMYSAGATSPDLTIGGLAAAKWPDHTVETLAKNGAKAKDMTRQFHKARYKTYDLIIIGVGGNDIIRFTAFSKLKNSITKLLQEASPRAKHIVLCHSVNVGSVGFFPFPLNYIYAHRSKRISKLYAKLAASYPNVQYANFYRRMHAKGQDNLAREEFLAADRFHGSDKANKYFFDTIVKDIPKNIIKMS